MRRVTLLTVPVLALVLAGCGGSGPNPGVALRLGDVHVSTRHVDDVVSEYCSALAKVGTTSTRQTVRNQVVGALAARVAAERYAEVKGVEAGSSYDTAVAKLRQQLRSFDSETQDAIIEVEGAPSYVTAVTGQTGEQAFSQWLGGQHVRINPVYGVALTDDRLSFVDPSVSVAASEVARTAVKAAADPSASPAAGATTCG